METINIMTSSDDKLSMCILPQIASIGENLSGYHVNLFLLHHRISPANIEVIKSYAQCYDNISFNEIYIKDVSPYNKLQKTGGVAWPYETYLKIAPHVYLPESIERILIIDAGDVILTGDIGEFYFDDFDGNYVIATLESNRNDKKNFTPHTEQDLTDSERVNVLRWGTFNAGVFMLNVIKMRSDNITIHSFTCAAAEIIKKMPPMHKTENPVLKRWYIADQGLYPFVFAGKIKYYELEKSEEFMYWPYNFNTSFWYTHAELWYVPKIIHFILARYKPWKARFPLEDSQHYIRPGHAITVDTDVLKRNLYEQSEIWWRFCEKTPIYEKFNRRARFSASAYTRKIKNIKWKAYTGYKALLAMAASYASERRKPLLLMAVKSETAAETAGILPDIVNTTTVYVADKSITTSKVEINGFVFDVCEFSGIERLDPAVIVILAINPLIGKEIYEQLQSLSLSKTKILPFHDFEDGTWLELVDAVG